MASQALRLIEPEAPLALDLPVELTFDQWEAEGRRLSFTSHALQWFIGDWWNAGHKFGDEKRAETAKRLFGLEYGTVRNYGSVAGRVPVSLRSDNLPFAHYRELAALPAETVPDLINRAVEESLTVKALRAEVAAIRGDNVVPITRQSQPKLPLPAPEPAPVPKNELTECYARYVEAMESLEEFRPLSKRELDFLTIAKDALGEAYAERRPCPDDFDVVFVEQGRLACESWYGASRITVNRWLMQRGKKRLIDDRANFVKHQRNMAKGQMPLHADDAQPTIDVLLPVARQAAQHLRVSRYGGWVVTQREGGGWCVGTVRKTSEELIVMAERQGFNRQAAAVEAEREGY